MFIISAGSGNLGYPSIPQIDTAAGVPLGTQVNAYDPFWGAGEFQYLKANGAIALGNLVIWDNLFQATACPNTANQGRPVAVALAAMSAAQFGWFQVSGQAVISATASVAAGTVFG